MLLDFGFRAKPKKATRKQKIQRELAWALYVCCGFRSAAKVVIPDSVAGKGRLLDSLEAMIHSLHTQIRRIN